MATPLWASYLFTRILNLKTEMIEPVNIFPQFQVMLNSNIVLCVVVKLLNVFVFIHDWFVY